MDDRYVYICFHQDSFDAGSFTRFSMTDVFRQTIKDCITNFNERVKYAGEFNSNNIIRPIGEGVHTIIVKIPEMIFLTLTTQVLQL